MTTFEEKDLIEMYNINPSLFRVLPDKLKTLEMCKNEVFTDWRNLECCGKFRNNPDICELALTKSSEAIQYCGYQTQAMCNNIFDVDPSLICFFQPKFITKEMVDKLSFSRPDYLRFMILNRKSLREISQIYPNVGNISELVELFVSCAITCHKNQSTIFYIDFEEVGCFSQKTSVYLNSSIELPYNYQTFLFKYLRTEKIEKQFDNTDFWVFFRVYYPERYPENRLTNEEIADIHGLDSIPLENRTLSICEKMCDKSTEWIPFVPKEYRTMKFMRKYIQKNPALMEFLYLP